MRIIKKDFINENTESFCGKGRKLTSGKAYFMITVEGKLVYGGKQCAKEHSDSDLSKIPDLTKSLISNYAETVGGNEGGTILSQRDTRISKALSYLLLREEKLSGFKYCNKPISYHVLQEYYQKYQQNHNLPDSAISHILNIEKKLSKGKLSIQNLYTCYAYQHILKRVRIYLKDNPEGINYINSLLESLHDHCSLTDNQIHGLSRWLQYLPEDLRNAKLKKFL